MTPHTVRNIIIISLALAVLHCIPLIFFGGDSVRVAEYGVCLDVGIALFYCTCVSLLFSSHAIIIVDTDS